jgi:hypothetical protein
MISAHVRGSTSQREMSRQPKPAAIRIVPRVSPSSQINPTALRT